MPLTSTGLTIPRLNDIIEQQGEELRNNLGVNIDLSEDSVAGIINDIYSTSLSDVYELAQAIYEARDIYKANGVQLDILATYLGTSRIGESLTIGDALFTGSNGTTIPQGSFVSTVPRGDRFTLPLSVTISNLAANSMDISVASVANNEDYEVNIDGSQYLITSDGDATETEIVDALEALLTGGVGFIISRNANVLTIDAATSGVYDPTKSISVTLSTNLDFDVVSSLGSVEAVESGPIEAQAGSLTNIETQILGWDSVSNPLDLDTGREIESDVDLRDRLINIKSRAGAGTFDAIGSRVLEVSGVNSVAIIENPTGVPDGAGRPSHSYEVIVVGGDDDDIGDIIWETKPAGIQTFGNTSVQTTDFDGNLQTVNFSRPTPIYIHVEVEYTLYDEEEAPTKSERDQAIADLILELGNALESGVDVISRRFIGPIYNQVSGLQDVVVKVDSTINPGDTPTDLQEKNISITENEFAEFDSTRITITEL